MAQHNELGKLGEQLAVEYLLRKGYQIIRKNFIFHKAEIDIIAQKNGGDIVVVEVKTRNSTFFGDPESFVTPNKIKQLIKAADAFVTNNALNKEVRFDIIAIVKNKDTEKIEHYENAFYHF